MGVEICPVSRNHSVITIAGKITNSLKYISSNPVKLWVSQEQKTESKRPVRGEKGGLLLENPGFKGTVHHVRRVFWAQSKMEYSVSQQDSPLSPFQPDLIWGQALHRAPYQGCVTQHINPAHMYNYPAISSHLYDNTDLPAEAVWLST